MNWKGPLITFLSCIGLFIVALLTYFHPTLSGEEVRKDDHLNSRANSQEIYEHRDKFGEEPLWTNSQFSGMPTFQMSTQFPNNLVEKVKTWLSGKHFFPSNTGLIFTLFLGFFIMLLVMKVDPWLALIGGFAFAFSTYFMTSYEAGHTGKLRVIGFIAPCIATIHITLRGKWILGGALTAFTVCSALASNHLQINYYLALLIVILMITEGIAAYRKGKIKAYSLSAGILLFAAILSIGPNISSIWSTRSYSQETIRGEGSPLKQEQKDVEAGGLDKNYAMRWSYGKMESFNLLIPSLYGGGTNTHPDQDSKTADALKRKGVSGARIDRMLERLPLYWGDQPFTAGPNYLGAVIVFLFVTGIMLVQRTIRNWILIASAIAIMMAWGRHFSVLNNFLFEYLPLYNKFRSPSMILTIVCFTAPLLAILGVQEILRQDRSKELLKKALIAFGITGGICLFFAMLGPAILDLEGRMAPQLERAGFLDNLKEDRATLLQQSAMRSFVFIALAFGVIWAYLSNYFDHRVFIAGIGVLVVVDLWAVDKQYLNDADFSDPGKGVPSQYRLSNADRQILQQEGFEKASDIFYPGSMPKDWTDPDQHYRVYNTIPGDPFSDAFTSYHHRSIGGYHAAKLIRYQDLIEDQIQKGNLRVLNMLNAKWFIVRPENEKQRAREVARRNPGALGNAWFVEKIRWAGSAKEEMGALDSSAPVMNPIDPANTAVVHKAFKDHFTQRPDPVRKAGSTIDLTFYKGNELRYKANVKGNKGHLAVFSEVYYEGNGSDWDVYIDGEHVPHIRVNYALRGLWVPPGEHKIRFKFQPPSYYQGEKIALASSILIFILMILGILYQIRKDQSAKTLEEQMAIEEDPLEKAPEKGDQPNG